MRKLYSMGLLIVILLALTACSKPTNTISEAKLTDREKTILQITADNAFMFDYKADDTFKELSIWLEKYEFGKMVDEKMNLMTGEINGDGTIFFASLRTPNLNESPFNFTFGIMNDGNISTITGTDPKIETDTSTWGSNETAEIPNSGEIVLAYISYSNGAGIRSLNPAFYNDVKSHLDEIKNYDVVYLLKCEFK